jgi:hypothetical protein
MLNGNRRLQMKKWIIIFGVLIFMAVTNPSKAEFVAWAEQQAIKQSDGLIEKGLAYLAAGTWADSLTETKDYVIFSTYTMLMPDGNEMTFIGVFNKFLPIGNAAIDVNGVVSGTLAFLSVIVIALIVLRLLRWLANDTEEDDPEDEEEEKIVG